MNGKELTKTFMMISNWTKPFGLLGFWYVIFQISRDLITVASENEKNSLTFLFNMYREDTSTLTQSFNLNDPHICK